MERVGCATIAEALLDLCGVALHVFAEGGVALQAAVLDYAQHLELHMHIVLLEPLEQKVNELLAGIRR